MTVEDRVRAAIAGADPALAAAVGPALEAAAMPGWPPVALPGRVGAAYGLADVAGLQAACVLFFAAADVMDDAQDGDLDAAAWPGGWRAAVSAGMALAFTAMQAAGSALMPAFARAGRAMGLGQLQDLAQHGMPGEVGGEAEYLACVRAKTGASIALFAAAGAIAAGAPPAEVEALWAWGEATGARLQLASDVADLAAPGSRDRRQGRVTLPVLRAWARLSPAERPLLAAAWRGEPDAPDLGFLIMRSGAATAVEARGAALGIEAKAALARAALPAGLAADLEAWAAGVVAARAGGPRV